MEGEMTGVKRGPAISWTSADDEILRSMVRDRVHTRAIALQMKRTPTEIRKQASKLNILLRRARPQRQMS
jgi:hypothetical protein